MDEQQKEVGTMLPQQETELSQEQEQQTPECLNRFSVGAFFLGWLWGVCNRVWIALLGLIPIVNIIMMFVLGFKGNKWAWEKQKDEKTPEDFDKSQSNWAVAGWIIFGLNVFIGIVRGLAE